MALQTEMSPPIVGDANKDTKIDGDTKSDDNDNENEVESSQSTEEDVDLEEGEILDSEAEEEEVIEPKEATSLKDALDKKCLESIQMLVSHAKKPPGEQTEQKKFTVRRERKKPAKYHDHDQMDSDSSNPDDGWCPASKYNAKYSDKPIDYRRELEAYRGTPPSSPDRKKDKKKKKSKKSKKPKKLSSRQKEFLEKRRILKPPSTRICKFFKEGKCTKGSDCQFSHYRPTKKKELCKFYLNGHCNKGRDCTFMHSEFPCKFYHTGSECYSKDNCRFSHAPLDEEMKKVLADYLRSHRNNDEHDRKRRYSRSPDPQEPPLKRPSLLGSPPRHIKEAEETKRWQEEMKRLQQQNQPGFEIYLSPRRDNESPPAPPSSFVRPNFYQDTLQNTPSPEKRKRRSGSPERYRMKGYQNDYPENEYGDFDDRVGNKKIPEEDDVNWKNISELVDQLTPPKEENFQREIKKEPEDTDPDFTSDVKFDETTQFSEMESSIDYAFALSPTPMSRESTMQEEVKIKEEKQSPDNTEIEAENPPDSATTADSSPADLPPPIVIPSHLPRKQRELFLRIQQHQKRTAMAQAAAASDLSSSPGMTENSESETKNEESDDDPEKPEEERKESWYSSEDDDDDDDIAKPLANALKKLQEPPKKEPEPKIKPPLSIMQMLSKIQQKNTDESKPLSEAQIQQRAFWKNLLTGAVPPADATSTALSQPASAPPPPPKRRTLLPNPVPKPVETKETLPPKDPRLKNRDPRTLSGASVNSSDKESVVSTSASILSSLLPKIAIPTASEADNIPYRLHGIFTKPRNYSPYVQACQSDPKLLNDPRIRKHLNPPSRSEKVVENDKEPLEKLFPVKEPTPAPPKDIPPMPALLLSKLDTKLEINIFEPRSSTKHVDGSIPKTTSQSTENKTSFPFLPKRTLDLPLKRRDSHSGSESSTPPHLTIAESNTTEPSQESHSAPILESAVTDKEPERKWLPPVLEKSWAFPVLEQKWSVEKSNESDSDKNSDPPKLEINESFEDNSDTPIEVKKEIDDLTPALPELTETVSEVISTTPVKKPKPPPASHLPRAIADPRMARLHHRVEPRRSRKTSDITSKTLPKPKVTEAAESAVQPETMQKDESQKDKPTETEESKPIPEEDKLIVEEKNPIPEKNKFISEDPEASNKKTEPLDSDPEPAAEVESPPAEKGASKTKKMKNIPKKGAAKKNEEKKKTVHRNRKSSMDYASPLNSCDDSNTNSLGYNSYNQRPKRKRTTRNSSGIGRSPSAISITPVPVSDFLMNETSNQDSNDSSLKDKFKTIDPTASPFC